MRGAAEVQNSVTIDAIRWSAICTASSAITIRGQKGVGENMCTNRDLETRIVILEAALDWVRHEARGRLADPHTMERIAAIATQVLEDDESTMIRRRAYNAHEAELRAG